MYILHSYVMLRCKDSRKTVLTDYVSNPRIEQLHRTYLYGYIFLRTSFDKKITPSVTDRKFVNQMDEEFHKDTDGYWSPQIAFQKS